jgi:hypothetical protein
MADKSTKKPATNDAEPKEAPAVVESQSVKAETAVKAETPPAKAAPAPDHAPVSEDAKLAFAAALERKKQAGQARSAHLDGHSGVGGATSSHKATRTFRRKSGAS